MLCRERRFALLQCNDCGADPKILYSKKVSIFKGIKSYSVVCSTRKCGDPEWSPTEKTAILNWNNNNKE